MKNSIAPKIILCTFFFAFLGECKTNAAENIASNSALPPALIQELRAVSFKDTKEGLKAAKDKDEKSGGLYSRGSGKLYYLVGGSLYKYDSASTTEANLVGEIIPPHDEHHWDDSLGVETSYSTAPIIFIDLNKKQVRSSGKTTLLVTREK
ncbi:MAG: hypothetical protein K2W94_05855 [Alphaproteobacteria bacterium]|nr:hypothetical protein [Alphaproteobacteria bacterium]